MRGYFTVISPHPDPLPEGEGEGRMHYLVVASVTNNVGCALRTVPWASELLVRGTHPPNITNPLPASGERGYLFIE